MRDAIKRELPKMQGWSTVEKCERIYDLILDFELKDGVEIGTFGGKATLAAALAFKQTGGSIWTCDPYRGEDCCEGSNAEDNNAWWNGVDFKAIYYDMTQTMLRMDVWDQVRFVRCRSDELIKMFDGPCFDFMHQDGVHNLEVAGREVREWSKLMKPGAFWVADDIGWKEMVEVKELIEEEMQWELIHMQPGDQSYAIYRLP